jgi:pyruvate-ferredoxin/flavodoxin oxidoreductase
MPDPTMVTLDGNEPAAYIAHLTNEVIAIYPITPALPMGGPGQQFHRQPRPGADGP